ncbi:MAG TPA: type II toxin-antitoxin system RelE/ParE family toxin [Thermoguttaceae bacterium]|nr:type II toxin-antitoxin system RelE/ParE family toxin [Thermoguttaceae bacterium]
MTCRLILQPEAEADLTQAYRWYEAQRPGLGGEFIECVEIVFERIRKTPEFHAVVYKDVRQALVRRFPYVVCYVFQEGQIDVVAVFHGHRDPAVWESRVDGADVGPNDDD